MAHLTNERKRLVEIHLPPIEVALRLTSTRKIGEIAAAVYQRNTGRPDVLSSTHRSLPTGSSCDRRVMPAALASAIAKVGISCQRAQSNAPFPAKTGSKRPR